VTTDGGQDWVIPKGNVKGSFRQTASVEAWEEAGVKGKISRRPLASFKYRKAGETYRVKVYLLRASHVSFDWPESKARQRKWLPAKEAMACLKYGAMRKALQAALLRRAA
jgi:8-oxo-dGTP pyrophosphatase MutT (NUDIX family)